MSAPAMNALSPAPVRTTPRIEVSSRARAPQVLAMGACVVGGYLGMATADLFQHRYSSDAHANYIQPNIHNGANSSSRPERLVAIRSATPPAIGMPGAGLSGSRDPPDRVIRFRRLRGGAGRTLSAPM